MHLSSLNPVSLFGDLGEFLNVPRGLVEANIVFHELDIRLSSDRASLTLIRFACIKGFKKKVLIQTK
jgi:hypothetical protein